MTEAKKKPTEIHFTVVGLDYYLTPGRLDEITELLPLSVELDREPQNLEDKNAVAVKVIEKPYNGYKIGYLPRAVAEAISPKLKKGKMRVAEAWLTEIDVADSGRGHQGKLLVKVEK